jgi:hypothetical protein
LNIFFAHRISNITLIAGSFRTTVGIIVTTLPRLGASSSPGSLPVFTEPDQVNRLTPEQANKGYLVDIRGVVTYADVRLGHIFIQNQRGGTFVYFHPTGLEPELHAGQTIDVKGITTAGDFSPLHQERKIQDYR